MFGSCSYFCCCLPLEYAAYILAAFQIILSIFAITISVSAHHPHHHEHH